MQYIYKILSEIFIALIKVYQVLLSPDQGLPKKLGLSKGYVCKHNPSCSAYTIEMIRLHGPFHGLAMGVKQIWRCRQ